MKVLFTSRFERSYRRAPATVQRAFEKQLEFLLDNLQHPSLRAKKYDNERWQGRVSREWRFYFRIDGDTYIG
jgi:mRNA-degrading endonuclease RelE of RelBE toxin-antitoxin system